MAIIMRPGTTLGKYTIEAYLGGGGSGHVYRATQRGPAGFSRQVALKVLQSRARRSGDAGQLFAREARTLALLQHRNIVQVHEFACEQGCYFLVMEFVDGVTLWELIRLSHNDLAAWMKVWIGVEICRGLQHAHTLRDERGAPLGIVHRDIKPQNILISRQADVKLTDFGLAKMSLVPSDQLTSAGVIKGTPAYMSPEQRDGLTATSASDVYSLAAVLYETCTGHSPGRAGLAKGLLPPESPDLPPRLHDALRSALSLDPTLRPSSTELGSVLQEVLSGLLPAGDVSREAELVAPLVEKACRQLAERKVPPDLAAATAPAEPPGDFRGFVGATALAEEERLTSEWRQDGATEATTVASAEGSGDPSMAGDPPARRIAAWSVLVVVAVVASLILLGVGYLGTGPIEVVSPRGDAGTGEAGPFLLRATAPSSLPDGAGSPSEEGSDSSPGPTWRRGTRDAAIDLPAADLRLGLEAADLGRLPRTTPVRRIRPSTGRRPRRPHRRKPEPQIIRAGAGFLSVNTSPWARVYLDGRLVGVTPLYRTRVSSGMHTIRLVGNNGRVAVKRVRVPVDGHVNLGLLSLRGEP